MSELLQVNGLRKHFPVDQGVFSSRLGKKVSAVDDVSFSIEKGKTLGLVGESGCGKSTTGRCVIRLLKPTEGSIDFDGVDVATLKGAELKAFRRDAADHLPGPLCVAESPHDHRRDRLRAAGDQQDRDQGRAQRHACRSFSRRSASTPSTPTAIRTSSPAGSASASASPGRSRSGPSSSSATSRSRRSMSRSRRKSSTCSSSCRTSSTSRTCSSRTTSRWCATSPMRSR